MAEQVAQAQRVIRQLAQARHRLGRQQRMAAQFEEVIIAPDLLKLQHLLPDRGDLLFQPPDRGDEAARRRRGIHLRQGLAVDLAVGAHRQSFEQQHMGRHHVVRQALTQARVDFITHLGRPLPRASTGSSNAT